MGGGHMKRLLACLLILLGLAVAGCEEEHVREYRYPEYHRYPEYRGYPEHREHRGYRLKDETLRNDQREQTEATVEQ
jgi:hypothetical protein